MKKGEASSVSYVNAQMDVLISLLHYILHFKTPRPRGFLTPTNVGCSGRICMLLCEHM